MLSYFVLLVVAIGCCGALIVAAREHQSWSGQVKELVRVIDLETGDGEPGSIQDDSGAMGQADELRVSVDVRDLIHDIVESNEHALAVLAVNELTGRAALARTRTVSLSRGLARICLMSGAAGAFFIAALGAFGRDSLVLAGSSVALGVTSSMLTHSMCIRARRSAKKYAELVDVLARQVEGRFSGKMEES